MKTMCPSGYHHNGFVEVHALGHMIYGKFFSWLHINDADLASVGFEHSVCHGSLMTTYIYIYIYTHIYIYISNCTNMF